MEHGSGEEVGSGGSWKVEGRWRNFEQTLKKISIEKFCIIGETRARFCRMSEVCVWRNDVQVCGMSVHVRAALRWRKGRFLSFFFFFCSAQKSRVDVHVRMHAMPCMPVSNDVSMMDLSC
jgi:hypothetical protein